MNKNKTRTHPISDDNDQSIVPDGYKQTEAGIIPENWDEVRVGNIAKVKGGKRLPSGFVLVDTPTPHPYVRVKDMYPGGVNQSEIKYVPEQAFPAIQNYRIYSQDVFISVAGSLGIVGVVPPELSGANLTENADYITDLKCDRDYLKYYLMSEPIQKVIQLIQTTGAQPKLALGRIAKFVISIPQDINEQRAIAEALSDVDGLLNALEALIAKKRAIKQAVMQQLLTGKTRLPGFSGAWETKRLGDIGVCLRGVSYDPTMDLSSFDTDSTVRLLRSNNIQDAVVTAIDVQYVESRKVSESQVMLSDDILVCMANGSKELVGKAGLFRFNDGYIYTFGAFMGCFRVEPTIAEPNFVFYIFQTHGFRNFINLILAGSSINNLKPSDIESAEFQVPDRDEQRSIVSVLSDMDAEIVALEQCRDKTRAIKQGMMQQLLTGRVRLPESRY